MQRSDFCAEINRSTQCIPIPNFHHLHSPALLAGYRSIGNLEMTNIAAQAFIAFLRCEAQQAEDRAKSLRNTAAAIEANTLEGTVRKCILAYCSDWCVSHIRLVACFIPPTQWPAD